MNLGGFPIMLKGQFHIRLILRIPLISRYHNVERAESSLLYEKVFFN